MSSVGRGRVEVIDDTRRSVGSTDGSSIAETERRRPARSTDSDYKTPAQRKAKRDENLLKKKIAAATRLQAAFRGRKARKEEAKRREQAGSSITDIRVGLEPYITTAIATCIAVQWDDTLSRRIEDDPDRESWALLNAVGTTIYAAIIYLPLMHVGENFNKRLLNLVKQSLQILVGWMWKSVVVAVDDDVGTVHLQHLPPRDAVWATSGIMTGALEASPGGQWERGHVLTPSLRFASPQPLPSSSDRRSRASSRPRSTRCVRCPAIRFSNSSRACSWARAALWWDMRGIELSYARSRPAGPGPFPGPGGREPGSGRRLTTCHAPQERFVTAAAYDSVGERSVPLLLAIVRASAVTIMAGSIKAYSPLRDASKVPKPPKKDDTFGMSFRDRSRFVGSKALSFISAFAWWDIVLGMVTAVGTEEIDGWGPYVVYTVFIVVFFVFALILAWKGSSKALCCTGVKLLACGELILYTTVAIQLGWAVKNSYQELISQLAPDDGTVDAVYWTLGATLMFIFWLLIFFMAVFGRIKKTREEEERTAQL